MDFLSDGSYRVSHCSDVIRNIWNTHVPHVPGHVHYQQCKEEIHRQWYKKSHWLSHVMCERQSVWKKERECNPSTDRCLSGFRRMGLSFTMFVFLVFSKELYTYEVWGESWPIKANIWTVVFSQRWAASHMPAWVSRLPLSHLQEVYMCTDLTVLSISTAEVMCVRPSTPEGRGLNAKCSLERPQETWDSFAGSVRPGPSASGWEIALGTHSRSIKAGRVSLRLVSWHAACF